MAQPSFQITVPNKTAAGQLPVMKMKAVVAVETEASVTFKITDPRGAAVTRTIGPVMPGGSPSTVTFDPAPPGAVAFSSLTLTPPSTAAPIGDPSRRRYVFFFNLDADFDVNNNCQSTMAGAETWTIEVTAGPSITSACLQSFDRNIAGQRCVGTLRPVPLTEPVATVVGFPGPQQGCLEYRPGLDVVLVLDRSGSMAGAAKNGQVTPTRIDELRGNSGLGIKGALPAFAEVWNTLRGQEGAQAPIDNIGVTLFDDQVEWWSVLPSHLNSFDAALNTTINSQANTIQPRNLTSIGKGVIQADGELNVIDSTRRRVILLMTDGLQNTDPMVTFDNPADPHQVQTYLQATPNVTTPLLHQSNYQIYTVTIGPASVVDAQITQNMAKATHGFYINIEDDASLLSSFFLELLQNFIRFNTWETHRLIRAQLTAAAPAYTVMVPMSTTTQHVVVVLKWSTPRVELRLSVTPPGAAQPTVASNFEGLIVLNFDVPTSDAYDYTGEWKIIVDFAPIIEIGFREGLSAATESGLDFDLAVLGDDAALDTSMEILPNDYVPDSFIQLEARVTEFGQPVLGLGSQPGDEMVAQLVKPGVGVGDLLADSTAPTTQPFAQDFLSAAQSKLYNHLQQHPESLNRQSEVITLKADADGVYRGRYRVTKPGHYNFLFGLTGKTKGVGRFSRQQLKTVYVRSAPDGGATATQTSIQSVTGGNQLVINLTPRTKLGDRLGPGWANYFWFTSPGITPFKAQDNLDGTYTAKLLYQGLLPPPVTVHFINVAMVISDAVTPDKLPVPLDSSSVLIPFVNPLPFPLPWLTKLPWWLVYLILFILIIAFILRAIF